MRPILLAVALLLSMGATAATAATTSGTADLPRFEDYPAGPAFAGRNRLVLRPNDMTFRTRLREAAGQPPNFAGHYVLGVWGCGTECIRGAAVAVRPARVTWRPGALGGGTAGDAGPAGPAPEVEPVRYRLDSRLILLTGRRNERDGDDGEHYYLIEGDRFVHLRDLPAALPRP